MRRLLVLLLTLYPALALAQGTVQQSGPVGRQHLAMYIGNGRVVDAGGPPAPAQPPANQANPGTLPNGLGVVNNNLGFANFSGYSGHAYSEFLWGMDYLGTGDGLIKLDRVGGGGPLTLWCEINHVRFECFNGSGGGTVTSILAEHGLYATPTNPITHSGNIGCDTISASVLGCGKVDGTTITADVNGVISAVAGDCPTATVANKGCVKPDGTTITITVDGTISATGIAGCNEDGGAEGQVCNSTGGGGAVWGSRVIGEAATESTESAPVTITGGTGTETKEGAEVTITGGAGRNGAAVSIAGGAALVGTNRNGGPLSLMGGAGDATGCTPTSNNCAGFGGSLVVASGAAGVGRIGAEAVGLSLKTGDATGTNNSSGDIAIVTGAVDNASPDALAGGILIATRVGSAAKGVAESLGGGIVIAAGANPADYLPGNVGSVGNRNGVIDLFAPVGIGLNIDSGWVVITAPATPATSYISFRLMGGGHLSLGGPVTDIPFPALSSCGTSPSFPRTVNDGHDMDVSGVIKIGTGGVTSCTMTFAHEFVDSGFGHEYPACIATMLDAASGAPTVGISAISNTAVTFSFSADASAKRVSYFCPQ